MSENGFAGQRLPKSEILRKRDEIDGLFNHGSTWNGEYIKFFFHQSDRRKVAFFVSRKFGNAVDRNRIKRLMREVYRQNRHRLENLSMLMLARQNARRVVFRDLEAEFNRFIALVRPSR